jgi:hypothetical protein
MGFFYTGFDEAEPSTHVQSSAMGRDDLPWVVKSALVDLVMILVCDFSLNILDFPPICFHLCTK